MNTKPNFIRPFHRVTRQVASNVEVSVATKKTYDPAIDPLMIAAAELEHLEARSEEVGKAKSAAEEGTVEKTYTEAERHNVYARILLTQAYMTTLRAQSLEGCIVHLRLLRNRADWMEAQRLTMLRTRRRANGWPSPSICF